ncbi:glycosyltransferase family 4 protein [Boudabousia tangfeifanii]|uniref:glycosyltransferase family 4 protein n=1 Tax=Boudabousia tangfeifanii TaxID=1912795 RepID=UPI00147925CF|nr:glycosyltransferase family 4 protein [Boudabousia tangfeifanii]
MAAAGGVQAHVLDLADSLRAEGHLVSVLAPTDGAAVPNYVYSAGHSRKIEFNGSVAPIAFSPTAVKRTRDWLKKGKFDLVHIHEPFSPSVGLFALQLARCPIVGTFHAGMSLNPIRRMFRPFLRSWARKFDQRIAVSVEAQKTLQIHEGLPSVIVPNGVWTKEYETATINQSWQGTEDLPVFGFLGRLDDQRKGLKVMSAAIKQALAQNPKMRFLIVGPGQAKEIREDLASYPQVEFLGPLYGEEKASFYRSITAYVAPHTGGESFGIVLVEAMAAQTLVIGADIDPFVPVLAQGKVAMLFPANDSQALADAILDASEHPQKVKQLALAGQEWAKQYDWQVVTAQIMEVYQAALRKAQAKNPRMLEIITNFYTGIKPWNA